MNYPTANYIYIYISCVIFHPCESAALNSLCLYNEDDCFVHYGSLATLILLHPFRYN